MLNKPSTRSELVALQAELDDAFSRLYNYADFIAQKLDPVPDYDEANYLREVDELVRRLYSVKEDLRKLSNNPYSNLPANFR